MKEGYKKIFKTNATRACSISAADPLEQDKPQAPREEMGPGARRFSASTTTLGLLLDFPLPLTSPKEAANLAFSRPLAPEARLQPEELWRTSTTPAIPRSSTSTMETNGSRYISLRRREPQVYIVTAENGIRNDVKTGAFSQLGRGR